MNKNEFEKKVWESSMNPTAKLIALAVSSHGDWDTGLNVKPSKTRIAGMAECTRDTAGKYIDALEEQGWLRYVKTHATNKKEYELADSVVEPVGILAKRKRSTSQSQLSNLSATTTESTCRDGRQLVADSKDSVAETKDSVVDSVDTTLLEPYSSPSSNLTSETPVADAPVPSLTKNEIQRVKSSSNRRFLNFLEKQSFDKEMSLNSVDEDDSKSIQRDYEYRRYPKHLNFEEAIDYLLTEYDYVPRSREEW